MNEPHVWNPAEHSDGATGNTFAKRLDDLRDRLSYGGGEGDCMVGEQILRHILARMDAAELALASMLPKAVLDAMKPLDRNEMACLLSRVELLTAAVDRADTQRIIWLKHLADQHKRNNALQARLDDLNARIARDTQVSAFSGQPNQVHGEPG